MVLCMLQGIPASQTQPLHKTNTPAIHNKKRPRTLTHTRPTSIATEASARAQNLTVTPCVLWWLGGVLTWMGTTTTLDAPKKGWETVFLGLAPTPSWAGLYD